MLSTIVVVNLHDEVGAVVVVGERQGGMVFVTFLDVHFHICCVISHNDQPSFDQLFNALDVVSDG
jgi:hypothetical protein